MKVTGRTGDGGIDGIGVLQMNLVSFKVVFPAKKWKEPVGAGVVRDFRGAMTGRGENGLIITTSRFSPAARDEASRDGAPVIDLVDGFVRSDLISKYNLGAVSKRHDDVSVNPPWFNANVAG